MSSPFYPSSPSLSAMIESQKLPSSGKGGSNDMLMFIRYPGDRSDIVNPRSDEIVSEEVAGGIIEDKENVPPPMENLRNPIDKEIDFGINGFDDDEYFFSGLENAADLKDLDNNIETYQKHLRMESDDDFEYYSMHNYSQSTSTSATSAPNKNALPKNMPPLFISKGLLSSSHRSSVIPHKPILTIHPKDLSSLNNLHPIMLANRRTSKSRLSQALTRSPDDVDEIKSDDLRISEIISESHDDHLELPQCQQASENEDCKNRERDIAPILSNNLQPLAFSTQTEIHSATDFQVFSMLTDYDESQTVVSSSNEVWSTSPVENTNTTDSNHNLERRISRYRRTKLLSPGTKISIPAKKINNHNHPGSVSMPIFKVRFYKNLNRFKEIGYSVDFTPTSNGVLVNQFDYDLPLAKSKLFTKDFTNLKCEYVSLKNLKVIYASDEGCFVQPKGFSLQSLVGLGTRTLSSNGINAAKITVQPDSVSEACYIEATPSNSQKVYYSRLNIFELQMILELTDYQIELTQEVELTVLEIFKNYCNFQLGRRTWVRGATKDERSKLIDLLYFYTSDIYPQLNRLQLEAIIRRGSYTLMQVRLRQDRRQVKLGRGAG